MEKFLFLTRDAEGLLSFSTETQSKEGLFDLTAYIPETPTYSLLPIHIDEQTMMPIAVYYDDEFLYKSVTPTLALIDLTGSVVDVLQGPIVLRHPSGNGFNDREVATLNLLLKHRTMLNVEGIVNDVFLVNV